MADVGKPNVFQSFIAPIKEWAQKFTAADTTPDKYISAAELSAWATKEALANPKMNLTSEKLQAYAAQAVALREEIDKAPAIPAGIENINKRFEWIKNHRVDGQPVNPRTMLISLIVAPEVDGKGPTGQSRTLSEFELRADLQRLAKETNQPLPADGGVAIAHELAHGMVALNGVQSIITKSTQTARTVLRENRDQLPFAEGDLKSAKAEEARIATRVKEANDSRITPAEILAQAKREAAASGQEISPQAQAAFASMMTRMMGPEGRAQSAKVLAKGIDGIKAEVTQSNLAGKLSAEFGVAINGKGGAVDQAQGALSEATQKTLAGLRERIAEPDARGKVPRGKITQEQYAEAERTYLENEKATGAAYAKQGQAAAKELTPQALNQQLMVMLDGAKKSILEKPEEQAAKERASNKGFTQEQLGQIVEARKVLGGFTAVEQPTVQQFSQAVQATAKAR